MRTIATQPRYLEIADELRRAIIDGELAPGEQIQPAADLAAAHHVARPTAERATAELMREGLLVSRPGAGLFVRPQPGIVRLARSWYQSPGAGSPWRAAMAAIGREGSWSSSSAVAAATPNVAERLGIEPGADAMRTGYLYTLDGAPAYLATSWEPLEITRGTPIMLPEAGPYGGAGVRDRMAVIGRQPTRCTEVIIPRALTVEEAGRLGLHAGMSITVVRRTYLCGDLPVETADIVLPPHIQAVYNLPVE